MADNKKYYYLKLKDNFYDSEQLIILQNMQDGYLYSDILMKLYLRSLKNEGKLMFNNMIPYTPQVLAQVVRHQVGTVERALKIFQELGLIEILDNGAIYMMDIQNFIGKSSTEADRIRNFRKQIANENKGFVQMYNKSTPEIELEKEIEIKKDIDIKHKHGVYGRVKLTDKEYNKLIEEYGKDFIDKQIDKVDEYIEMNNNKNKYKNFYLVVRKSINDKWFEKKVEEKPQDFKRPAWLDMDL